MSRVAQVVILCEDKQQQVFLYRLLKGLGYSNRTIYLRAIPDGKQSAEQYVREHYVEEVKANRVNHISRCLVVAVDADMITVDQRTQQLEQKLIQNGLNSRKANEPIALFIPKRNIETWINYLIEGGPVNETTEYAKLRGCERDCQPAVIKFIELVKLPAAQRPQDCPPSLECGLDEVQHIPQGSR